MLIRRIVRLAACIAVLAGASVVFTPQAAWADYIYCPPNNGACIIIVTGPGGGGGGGGGAGGGSGPAKCVHEQLGLISCHKPGLGWFNHTDSCFYDRLDLAIDDPLWRGHDPANGYMYAVWCWGGASAGWQNVGNSYLTRTPPGYGGLPSPISLALQAINRLPITGPGIRIAPDPAGSGLVGLPVWMWTTVTPRTWGPISATASVPGLSVTATARATRIVWKMGDGRSITCNNPGTAYKSSYGNRASPNCGHTYTQPSRGKSGGRFAVTATTTWRITWSGGGRSGTVNVTRASATTIRINELQVVTE